MVGAGIATGTPAELVSVPYVWSDQYGLKIQIVGRPGPGHDVHFLDGGPGDTRFLAVYTAQGQIVAAVAFGLPRHAARCRALVGRAATLSEARQALGLTGAEAMP